ncbi:MAG: hypothetical protein KIT58_19385, partial [Planctomycetota bacterium]|nr:hypothetical protein [Planctomycetota bacterium]
MGVLALLALVVLAPIGAVAFSRAQRARWTTAWERVARAHGLELRQNPWLHPAAATLEGEVQGRPCAIAVVVRKNVPVTARVSVAAESAAGLTLHLEREDATTWLEKRLGATEVVVGDEAFDARFCVRTDDIDGARALLDGALRASLLGAEADGLLVSPDGVVVEVRDTARGGADRFAGRVERAIEVAVDLAGRLERPSPD